MSSGQVEKQGHWEGRLRKLLEPIPVVDLLIMSWAIEAFRNEQIPAISKFGAFPGTSETASIGGRFFIPPWTVDALINERLSYGRESNTRNKRINTKNWAGIRKLVNTYSGLSNAESTLDFPEGGILEAMPRLFWPQYDWQIGIHNTFRIGRAWHVYANPEGKRAFERKHGLCLDTFLKISFVLYVTTKEFPSARMSVFYQLGFTRNELHQFTKIMGASIDGHSKFAVEIRSDSIPRDFRRSTVKERPVFLVEEASGNTLYVPSRESLLIRMTDGLYYDLVSDSDAQRRSGEQFEELCALILNQLCGDEVDLKEEQKTSYGKSCDLFLIHKEDQCEILVECKARRLPQKVLTSPNPWVDCEDFFSDIIKGIVQIWRTVDDFEPTEISNRVGLVLSYESWTILGNSFVGEIFRRAHDLADKHSIKTEHRIPVFPIGYADMERCFSRYDFRCIFRAVEKSIDEKFHGYELSGVLDSFASKATKDGKVDYMTLIAKAVPWWGELG